MFLAAPATAAVPEVGTPVQGCCLTICPPEEITRRQKHKLVHPLECRPPSNDPRMPPSGRHEPLLGSSELFVKEFSRSAAGQENAPSSVRPLPVLSRTVRYLLADALERTDVSTTRTHEFVADRLRAVVKDITLQDLLRNSRTATVLAACVRFHALHHYRMCSSRDPSFDAFTHRQQMEGVLLSLVRHYHDQDKNPSDKALQKPEQPRFSFDLDDDEDEFFIPEREDTDTESSDDGEGTSGATDVDGVSDRMVDLNLHNADHGCRASGNLSTNTQTGAKQDNETDSNNETENVIDNAVSNSASSDSHQTIHSNRWTNISATLVENPDNDNQVEDCSVVEPPLTSTWNNIDFPIASDLSDHPNSIQSILDCTSEREEMECAYLLLFFNSSEALQHGLELRQCLRKQPLLSSVLTALVSLQSTGNFVPLVRLMRCLPPILGCYLLVNFKRLQLKALQVLTMGHSSRNTKYPLEKLVTLLELADETEAKKVCQQCRLKVLGENQEFVSFLKDDFQFPDGPMDGPSRRDWLDTKLSTSNIRSLLMPHPLPLH